jgi:hypothetical protein
MEERPRPTTQPPRAEPEPHDPRPCTRRRQDADDIEVGADPHAGEASTSSKGLVTATC